MARHKFRVLEDNPMLDYGWFGKERFIITLEVGKENVYQITWPGHIARRVAEEIIEGVDKYGTPQMEKI